jgi:hypothetical protein
MKKSIESLVNRLYKEDFRLLLGEGSFIKVEDIIWSTNQKKYVIYVKLYVNDPEKHIDAYPEGVEYFVSESWKFLGIKNEQITICSIDINPS